MGTAALACHARGTGSSPVWTANKRKESSMNNIKAGMFVTLVTKRHTRNSHGWNEEMNRFLRKEWKVKKAERDLVILENGENFYFHPDDFEAVKSPEFIALTSTGKHIFDPAEL